MIIFHRRRLPADRFADPDARVDREGRHRVVHFRDYIPVVTPSPARFTRPVQYSDFDRFRQQDHPYSRHRQVWQHNPLDQPPFFFYRHPTGGAGQLDERQPRMRNAWSIGEPSPISRREPKPRLYFR